MIYVNIFGEQRTLLCFHSGPAHGKISLLKWPPFEILLISPTGDFTALALVAGRLRLIALQPLRLAGNATWAKQIDGSALLF